ncbi:MAG TPA: MarR family winged helix-turn-helix transcriptional regulator [Xanthobacteraceae bacterium]|nr:MarR family winged helix-turn-helix transcriptional regulator [Xanthobacteraceae bacterium]
MAERNRNDGAMPRNSNDGAVPTGCTCLRLRKAARRITQIYDRHVEPHGLTITQYGLLSHLEAHDGIGVGALAEKLVMDPTTLTRNLRPLERAGLLVLGADPNDRRSRCLRLTAEGRAVLKAARPAWARAQRHLEETLGAGDTAALHAALDRMLQRLGTA